MSVDVEEIDIDDIESNFTYPIREALRKIIVDANVKITAANERATSAEKARDEIEKEKSVIENEHLSDKEELDKLKNQKGREEAKAQSIDERIVDLVSDQPGDPGHLYDRDKRVDGVIKFAQSERDKIVAEHASLAAELAALKSEHASLAAELAALKAAIIPELERLEGHEKRLQVIVDEFAGKVKGERLSTLLREAQDHLI